MRLFVIACALLRAGAPALAQTTSGSATDSAAATSSTHHASSKHKAKSKKTKKKAAWQSKGQQKPDTERTQAIQAALEREHYLSKEPSGVWDADTQAAMEKYQADHGWQSKSVPDSRALISLGLGPDHEHLLNPQSAMTTDTISAVHPSPAGGNSVSAGPPPHSSLNQASSPK